MQLKQLYEKVLDEAIAIPPITSTVDQLLTIVDHSIIVDYLAQDKAELY